MTSRWWVAVAGLVSCRDATQIDVHLSGRGFECEPGEESLERFSETTLRVAPQMSGLFSQERDPWRDCDGGDPTDGLVELGNVVLVPGEGSDGPVEILAVAALEGQSTTKCLETYEAFLAIPSTEVSDLCIVARRSIGFIQHASLTLGITLDSRCAGIYCEASQTCVEGECVSAAPECDAQGCGGLGPGVGGAGAGGAGGTGGTGGTGGGPWEVLESGVEVRDVVGWSTNGAFHVAAATKDGRTLCEPDCVSFPQSPDGFETLATQNRLGPALLAIGDNNTAISNGQSMVPPDPVPSDRYDVAWTDGAFLLATESDVGCTALYDVTSLPLPSNPPGSGPCGIAVAMNGSYAILIGHHNTLALFDNVDSVAWGSAPGASGGDWSVWIPQTGRWGSDGIQGYAAVGEAVSSSVFRVRHQDGQMAAQVLKTVVNLDGTSTNLEDVFIDDLAVDPLDETHLYVVGREADLPWFARIAIDDPAAPMLTGALVPLDTDVFTAPPHAIWIGEHDGAAWITVGTGNELLRAPLSAVDLPAQ